MILKDKTLQNTISAMAKAGQKQEQDVAFFLRRAFKDHKKVFVINDYKFTFNNETAQIDHLIVYPYGFLLIESKSIKGEVKVNSIGEWTRSLNHQWSGMPSPIKQVELQQKLLREMLFANREVILSKLLGIKSQSFGFRCWHNICAVSSNAIIDRDTMQKSVSNQVVKTEFLVDKISKIMNLKNAVVSAISLFDTRPNFSNKELSAITSFLLSQDKQNKQSDVNEVDNEAAGETKIKPQLQCKSCGEKSDYSPQSGRYGYFIKCNKCNTNTSMKIGCTLCQSKNTKVTKKKESYAVTCNDCNSFVPLFTS